VLSSYLSPRHREISPALLSPSVRPPGKSFVIHRLLPPRCLHHCDPGSVQVLVSPLFSWGMSRMKRGSLASLPLHVHTKGNLRPLLPCSSEVSAPLCALLLQRSVYASFKCNALFPRLVRLLDRREGCACRPVFSSPTTDPLRLWRLILFVYGLS